MIANPMFQGFINQDVVGNLRSVGDEFVEAERTRRVTEQLGRKYHHALSAYKTLLYECPYSPTAAHLNPTEHTVVMRETLDTELTRIQTEFSRIISHFGGVLRLVD